MIWTTVDLITLTDAIGDMGDPTVTKAYAIKFAKLKSVRQTEYYQASANGLKPEHMFEITSADYSNEKRLRYPSTSGTEYEIIRAYDKGEKTELICQGITNK